jgi:hypothetical protein
MEYLNVIAVMHVTQILKLSIKMVLAKHAQEVPYQAVMEEAVQVATNPPKDVLHAPNID